MHFDANYQRLSLALRRLPSFAGVSAKFYTKASANQYLRFLQDHIKGDKLGLKKLKHRIGAPLYDTGELVDGLSVHAFPGAKRGRYHVGAIGNKKHRGSGLKISALMKIHEYGKTIKRGDTLIRIPPRPAIRLSWRKFIKEATLRGRRNRALSRSIDSLLRKADKNATALKNLSRVI